MRPNAVQPGTIVRNCRELAARSGFTLVRVDIPAKREPRNRLHHDPFVG